MNQNGKQSPLIYAVPQSSGAPGRLADSRDPPDVITLTKLIKHLPAINSSEL